MHEEIADDQALKSNRAASWDGSQVADYHATGKWAVAVCGHISGGRGGI
jgi:hypothetical protein